MWYFVLDRKGFSMHTDNQIVQVLSFFRQHVREEEFSIFMDFLREIRKVKNLEELDWIALMRMMGTITPEEVVVSFDPRQPFHVLTAVPMKLEDLPKISKIHVRHLDLKSGLKLACRVHGRLAYVAEGSNILILETYQEPSRFGSYGALDSFYEKLVVAGVLDDLRPYLPFNNHGVPVTEGGKDSMALEREFWRKVRRGVLGQNV
jgi:hypothetical protein